MVGGGGWGIPFMIGGGGWGIPFMVGGGVGVYP